MQEKRFHREEYPLDILEDFGLTEQMIYDLPSFVHETIETGGKSPLLPIRIEQPFGYTHAKAKFSLIETEHGIDVLFYPKLKSINLSQFSQRDQQLLLQGKVIVTDIHESISNDSDNEQQVIKAFVQIDRDTNDVVYTATQVIGRNLTAITAEYDLTGEQLQSFWNGELVSITETDEDGNEDTISIGVDLFSDKGVIIVPGSASHWQETVRKVMPEYSFGTDGCWINRNGQLQYLPEDEFTQDIYDILQREIQDSNHNPKTTSNAHLNQDEVHLHSSDDRRQVVR